MCNLPTFKLPGLHLFQITYLWCICILHSCSVKTYH